MCKNDLISDVNYLFGRIDWLKSYEFFGVKHTITKENKWLYRLTLHEIALIRDNLFLLAAAC